MFQIITSSSGQKYRKEVMNGDRIKEINENLFMLTIGTMNILGPLLLLKGQAHGDAATTDRKNATQD